LKCLVHDGGVGVVGGLRRFVRYPSSARPVGAPNQSDPGVPVTQIGLEIAQTDRCRRGQIVAGLARAPTGAAILQIVDHHRVDGDRIGRQEQRVRIGVRDPSAATGIVGWTARSQPVHAVGDDQQRLVIDVAVPVEPDQRVHGGVGAADVGMQHGRRFDTAQMVLEAQRDLCVRMGAQQRHIDQIGRVAQDAREAGARHRAIPAPRALRDQPHVGKPRQNSG